MQISRDRGKTWKGVRVFQSKQASPRNFTTEGFEDERALIRLAFGGYSANGTSGSPFATLTVEGAFVRGIVKITEFTNSKSVRAVTVTAVDKNTTSVWREGAWSDYQGFPGCVEFHHNRVLFAATTRSPHTIWASEDDGYNDFKAGTLATDPWAHTIMIGQREPISWLFSDRLLVIGSPVGEFVMFGKDIDSPITAEDRNVARHSPNGSHLKGPGVIAADQSILFVQQGGALVREMSYQAASERYEASNLNLLHERLFSSAGEITDFAIQRAPFQIVWWVAGGKLFSLTYEKQQSIAAWARHPTAATVVSVAAIRKSGADEVWAIINHGGTLTVESMPAAAWNFPVDDGMWTDSHMTLASPYSLTGNHLAGQTVVGWNNGNKIGPAVLNSGFFTGLSGNVVIGRPVVAKLKPMTPEIALNNGTSRTREIRIHELVLSLWKSRGGKVGEDPDGAKFDPIRADEGVVFTGEKPVSFDGRHSTAGACCVVHDEPFPFFIRSLTLKFNVHGDAS